MTAAGLRAVLFDKDGTLLDYRRTWEPINREAADLAAGGDPVLARRLLAAGSRPARASMAEAETMSPGTKQISRK